MSIPPTRRSDLERNFARTIIDSVTGTTFLKDFPVVKYGLYKVCRIKLGQKDFDLLESLTNLGQNIALIGFSFSLCALSLLPAICCIIAAIIFKYTGKALYEKRRFAYQIEQLTLANKHLTETQQQLTTVASNLQSTLHLEMDKVKELSFIIQKAKITTEGTKQLKEAYNQALEDHKKAAQQLTTIKQEIATSSQALLIVRQEFTEERKLLAAERKRYAAMRLNLEEQVDRLSKV